MQISEELRAVIRQSPCHVPEGRYLVAQVDSAPPPGTMFAVMADADEMTVIAEERQEALLSVVASERWFRLLEFRVAVPFEAPGFIASIAEVLAERSVNILVVSTFSKDYLLLREEDLPTAVAALRTLGFPMSVDQP